MATHVITISATNEKPFPLTISDDEGHRATTTEGDKTLITNFENGDIAKWVIDPNSNIISINAITESKTKIFELEVLLPIFGSEPAPAKDNSGDWVATMQMPANYVKATSEYTITYTIGGKQYTQDPKLQIRRKIT